MIGSKCVLHPSPWHLSLSLVLLLLFVSLPLCLCVGLSSRTNEDNRGVLNLDLVSCQVLPRLLRLHVNAAPQQQTMAICCCRSTCRPSGALQHFFLPKIDGCYCQLHQHVAEKKILPCGPSHSLACLVCVHLHPP